MKRLLALVLLTPFIHSNPVGGWRDDMYDWSYSYGGDGIWPYLLIGFVVFIIYAFIANWYDEYKEKLSQDNINKLEQEAKNPSISKSTNDLTDSQKKAWQNKLNKAEKRNYTYLFKYLSISVITLLIIGGIYSSFRYVKLDDFSNKFIELEPVGTYFDEAYKDSDYYKDFLDSDIYEEIKYAFDSYEQCKLGQKGFRYALAGVSWSNEEYIDIIFPGISVFNPLDRYIYRNFIYENKLSVCENNYLSFIRSIDTDKPGDIYLLMQL